MNTAIRSRPKYEGDVMAEARRMERSCGAEFTEAQMASAIREARVRLFRQAIEPVEQMKRQVLRYVVRNNITFIQQEGKFVPLPPEPLPLIVQKQIDALNATIADIGEDFGLTIPLALAGGEKS